MKLTNLSNTPVTFCKEFEFNLQPYQEKILADCKPAQPSSPWTNYYTYDEVKKKEEGINPMCYNAKANVAAATVVTAPVVTEAQAQRDYLMDRFENEFIRRSYADPKYCELRKMFNLDIVIGPKNYKELIDAIKNDKFKLDEKRIAKFDLEKQDERIEDDDDYYGDDGFYPYSMTDGIIWDGPQPDRKGFDKALKEYEKAKQDVKDAIIVYAPEQGLEAIKSLKDWKPSNAPVQ